MRIRLSLIKIMDDGRKSYEQKFIWKDLFKILQ